MNRRPSIHDRYVSREPENKHLGTVLAVGSILSVVLAALIAFAH